MVQMGFYIMLESKIYLNKLLKINYKNMSFYNVLIKKSNYLFKENNKLFKI